MLRCAGEYFLQHATRRRVLVAEAEDGLVIALDRNPFGDQVFHDHAGQRIALDVFRMAACGQPVRRKIRLAVEFDDAPGEQVGVRHFVKRMRHEFGGD